MDEPNRPDSSEALNSDAPDTPNQPPTPNWPPASPPTWRRLHKVALILLTAGEYADAEPLLRAALTAASSSPAVSPYSAELGTIWLDLAECLSALGDPTGSDAADAQARTILLHHLTTGTLRLPAPTTNKPTPD